MSLYSAAFSALSGEDCDPGEQANLKTAAAVAKKIVENGWSREKLLALRDEAHEQERRWPFPVSPRARGDVSPAQTHAFIQQVCLELELNDKPKLRDARMPLSAHDAQLIAQLPPHHGKVG